MVKRPSAPAPRTLSWIFPVLICVTLLAYAPAWHGGELWDDDGHLTRADLRSIDGLARIWTDIGATQQYYPLVHSAFWVMFHAWGTDTLGYHLVNIVLHAISACFVFVLLRRLEIPGAMPAAVIFALHPVQVESVAWMTELKNTLSGALALGAAVAYLRFDDGRRRGPYLLSLLLFTLALLSKSVTATLPIVLLILFWWRRGRIDLARDIPPLAPFLALAIAAGAMTTWVERALIGAKGAEFSFTIVERGLIAGRALWFYATTLLWPANLTFIYPRWNVSHTVWWQYLFPFAAIAVFAIAWRLRHRTRAPLAAALIFAAMLGPALGFVNVYPFRYSFVADHFQYLASIAVITVVVAGLHRAISARAGGAARADVALALALGMPLLALTWRQSHDYVSAETLYRATIARNPECWMAMHNLATLKLYGNDADLREAVSLTERSLALNPDNAEARNTLALAFQQQGRLEEALPHLREALRLNPSLAAGHNNLGAVVYRLGRVDEAEQHFRDALTLDPNYAEARRNLGLALMSLGTAAQRGGRGADAIARFQELVRIDDSSAAVHYALANALAAQNQNAAAIPHYRRAISLQPDARSAIVHNDLGIALALSGNLPEAITEFREALRLDPSLPDAKTNLARALASRKP